MEPTTSSRPDTTATELADLRAELADLRSELAALRAGRPADSGPPDTEDRALAGVSSRRNVLRLAGAAAVGAVGAAVVSAPVAADTGFVVGGGRDVSDVVRHRLTIDAPNEVGFLFTNKGAPAAGGTTESAALGGWNYSSLTAHGIYGFTVSGGLGAGVYGWGVAAGVRGASDGSGGVFTGHTSALRLEPSEDAVSPTVRTDEHRAGEIEFVDGDLWVCVAAGTPGRWRRLAGRSTTGDLQLVDAFRCYDSRRAQPTPGRLNGGTSRVVGVADRRSPSTGAVTAADAVPVGSTAVVLAVTVLDTRGAGALAVARNGKLASAVETVRWTAAGQTVTVVLPVQVDDLRRVKLTATGTGSAHVVLDVHGFHL